MKQKLKESKGITIISIIITVTILVLLSGVTIYIAKNLVFNAKVENITTDLLLIQAKCKIISEKTNFDSQSNNLKGTKLSDSSISTNVQNLIDNGTIPNTELQNYYLLSQDDLNDIGLNQLKAQDGYIVNYQTQEIIYAQGVKKDDGTMQYKLSDMKVDIDESEGLTTNDPNIAS